jgi:hypothetical protein
MAWKSAVARFAGVKQAVGQDLAFGDGLDP